MELFAVKLPVTLQLGEALLPELIPVRPMGLAVLSPESAMTSTAAFLTGVAKFTVIVPEVPVAMPRKAYMYIHCRLPPLVQNHGLLDPAFVVIRVAEPPDSGFAPLVLTTVAGRSMPVPLSSAAVTRMSRVCPRFAVTVLLLTDDKFPLLLAPKAPAANFALMPEKTIGLEASGVSVPPLVSRVLVVKV
jgi:hypothetical protein